MQPHSYAVAPLTVNVARRDMGLRLKAPEQVLPGSALSVSLSARHPGKALIFAVDEGVLQLTAFATPDPLRYLLNDRALEVETRQMFDLLMPDHGQLRIPAFGGDMALSGGRFHNPFKRKAEPPLSWWSGIVEVGLRRPSPSPFPAITTAAFASWRWRRRRIRRPRRNRRHGARSGGSDAATSGSGFAGDEFEAALAVANNTGQPASFALALSPDEALRVVSPPPVEIAVGAGSERVIPFRVKVGDVPGNAEPAFCRDRCRRKPDCPFRNAVRASGFAPARKFERRVGLRLHGSEDRARAVPLRSQGFRFRFGAAPARAAWADPLS